MFPAGCGSGYKSLILAEANPGAKIVGVDISPESIKLAEQRLKYHGFDNAEFHVLSIEDLAQFNYQFDYVNCHEMLYLFPEPTEALRTMKTVLKPIRSNLHSIEQRSSVYRAQKMFKMMGLMDENPEDLEIEVVVETMQALKDNVLLKFQTWNPNYTSKENKEDILMNHLFQGDKGYTVSDMFKFLELADLEFISIVNWREWDFRDLFKESDNLPIFWSMSLPDISIEERLKIYELLHPVHRLLDFWCGHPQASSTFVHFSEWSDTDCQTALVHLHPQLKTIKFKDDLPTCVTECRSFNISQYLSTNKQVVSIDSAMTMFLLPLLDKPQSMMSLIGSMSLFWDSLESQ